MSGQKLLDRIRIELRTKHYSPKTEKTYVSWIQRVRYSEVSQLFCKIKLSHGLKQFILFHSKRPPASHLAGLRIPPCGIFYPKLRHYNNAISIWIIILFAGAVIYFFVSTSDKILNVRHSP